LNSTQQINLDALELLEQAEDGLDSSINISRVISKKRELKQLAKEIKLEDDDFYIDGLSDLIEDLELESDHEEETEIKPRHLPDWVPIKPVKQKLSPIKEVKEDSVTPFA
jgi:hypothetical protein